MSFTINQTRTFAVQSQRRSNRYARFVLTSGIEDLTEALALAKKRSDLNHQNVCIFFGSKKIIEIEETHA
jgi:hypothetical protein